MIQLDLRHSSVRFIPVAALALGLVWACAPAEQTKFADEQPESESEDVAQLSEQEAWKSGYESLIRMLEHTGVTGTEEWKSAHDFSNWQIRREKPDQAGDLLRFIGQPPEGPRIGRFEVRSDGEIASFVNYIAQRADHPVYDEHGNVVSRPPLRSQPQWSVGKAVGTAREALGHAGIVIPEDYDLTICRYNDPDPAWWITWLKTYADGKLTYLTVYNCASHVPSVYVQLSEQHGVIAFGVTPGIEGTLADSRPLVTREEAAVKAGAVAHSVLRDEINPWVGTNYNFTGVKTLHLVARVPTWDLDPVRVGRIDSGEEEREPPRLAWAVELIGGAPENASPMQHAAKPEIQVFVDAMTGEIIGLDYKFGTGR